MTTPSNGSTTHHALAQAAAGGSSVAHGPAESSEADGRDGKRPGTVAACLLLAGGLKPSQLTGASGLSVLDLAVAPDQTLLDHWIDRLRGILDGRPGGGIRVIHCDGTPKPALPTGEPGVPVRIHADHQQFRGPAGVVRDGCADLDGEADVLIAEGARYIAGDLASFVESHRASGAEITVGANPDGSPAGLYIARRSTFDIVPQRGFMDLKEQWLSRAVERGVSVRVFVLSLPGAAMLRTRTQFLRACFSSQLHARVSSWFSRGFTRGVLVRGAACNVIARSAEVDPGALLAHTVVMPGATVGAGALVARSILCPGVRVAPGQEVVDAIVAADGVHFDHEGAPRGSKERA